VTGNLVQRSVGAVCQEPNLGRQGLQAAVCVYAEQNLQLGKSAFQSKVYSDPKAMSLAFKRQFRNEFRGTREQMLQAEEISPDRLHKGNGSIAPQRFDFVKHGVVFGQTSLDLVRLEMVGWEEIIYRELAVIGFRPAGTLESGEQQYQQQRYEQDIDDERCHNSAPRSVEVTADARPASLMRTVTHSIKCPDDGSREPSVSQQLII